MAINLFHRLHGRPSQLHNFILALKISSDEESSIAMGTFCHNWLARNTITTTPKLTHRRFSEPNKQILRMLKGFFRRVKMSDINSGDSPCKYF